MKNVLKETIINAAKAEGVKFIRLQFTDLFGQLKNVEIPVSQLEKALNNEMMFDGSSIEGFTRIEESDMYLHPDLNTWLILPWDLEGGSRVARLICDVYMPNGTPFEGDPRGILKRMLKEAEELGYTLFVGPEPEFFLFKKDSNGNVTTEANDNAGYFDLAPMDLGENCRRDIVTTLEGIGFEVEASHHEVAIGQHEIDFKYEDALTTADNIQTFKLVVKNIAQKHNLHATFMPKPIFGINGSGMHCNMSLFKGEENAFYDETTHNQLSEVANQFMAGVITHAKATAAITNPTVNSYKRIVPGYEAPVNIAWSTSNRTCMIRIPSKRGKSTRVEVRNPDPSANPYLTLAVLLKAGLDGIKKNMDVPQERKLNLYELSQEEKDALGIDSLPADLEKALAALAENEIIKEALGKHAYTHYAQGKEEEWKDYILRVTEWEKERYLGL